MVISISFLYGEFELMASLLDRKLSYKYVVYNEKEKRIEWEHLEVSDNTNANEFRNRVLHIPKMRKNLRGKFYFGNVLHEELFRVF